MYRRAKYVEHPRNVRFIEEHNMINTTQRRNQRHAFVLGKNWPAFILDQTHGFVAVEGNDQHVSQGARVFEVSQVPNMENVEAAVRENDSFSLQPRRQIFKPPKFHFIS